MSVIVAVRVRPFNQREVDINSRLCVKMDGNQTILIDEDQKIRSFAFDYSFWSHDNFTEKPDGLLIPNNQKYADQDYVYSLVGKQVLQNAIDGYHCCLFAYGQTGSGKSYSMIGFGPNKGIVPKISVEIFDLIVKETSKVKWFEVNISMLEIYNEKIQDLLIPINKRPMEGLKVRESQSIGVYVEDLTKHPVNSYEAIERKMDLGNQNRTIASTLMNACSSRAHTIITIEFKQIEIIEGKKVQRFSQINLVDLAGSEKFSKTGASGDRLKEGCSINKSLTVLGKVIQNLADKAMGKNIKSVTPYRESSLTRILQNALGGNSKTLMICAISPSNNNYEETLNTLRYADQAKKIKCNAVVNESETDKKIRELQKENLELKELLKKLQLGQFPMPEKQMPKELELYEDKEKEENMKKRIMDLEETLKANNLVMEEYQKTFEERLKDEKDRELFTEKQDLTIPHLTNLNEDPILSQKIYHNLQKKTRLVIGKGSEDFEPDIILRGIGMQEQHAIIQLKEKCYYLIPGNEEAQKFMCLNGKKIEQETKIHHLDRIAVGFNTIFLFRNPQDPETPEKLLNEKNIDWEMAQKEISKQLVKLDYNPETEIKNQSKYIEIEDQMHKIQDEYQMKIQQMEQQHQKKLEELQLEIQNNSMVNDEMIDMERNQYEEYKKIFNQNYEQQLDVEKQKKEEFEKQYIKSFKEKDKKKLEDKMYKINPNVIEANLIAQELNRNISFRLLINFTYVDLEDIKYQENKKKVRAKVEVVNHELGYSYFWDIDKFTLRYFMIRELLDQFYLTGSLPKLSQEDDPFWDPQEPIVLGEGFVKLMSLAYLVDNPNELFIVGDNGKMATVKINLVPVDEQGEELTEEHEIFDQFIDDPKDLFGMTIHFVILIEQFKKRN